MDGEANAEAPERSCLSSKTTTILDDVADALIRSPVKYSRQRSRMKEEKATTRVKRSRSQSRVSQNYKCIVIIVLSQNVDSNNSLRRCIYYRVLISRVMCSCV